MIRFNKKNVCLIVAIMIMLELSPIMVEAQMKPPQIVVATCEYRVSNRVGDDGQLDANQAIEIRDNIVKSIENALPSDTVCNDVACLRKVMKEKNVDYAFCVSVKLVRVKHQLRLIASNGQEVLKEGVATLAEMMDSIRAMASETVDAHNDAMQQYAERVAHAADTHEATTAQTEDTVPVAVTPEQPLDGHRRKPVHKAVFWSGVGLTAALGVTCGILEGVGASKRTAYDNDTTRSERTEDELRSIWVTNRVLMSATIATGLTTAVLGFFTDFSPKKSITVTAGIGQGSGELIIQGSF